MSNFFSDVDLDGEEHVESKMESSKTLSDLRQENEAALAKNRAMKKEAMAAQNIEATMIALTANALRAKTEKTSENLIKKKEELLQFLKDTNGDKDTIKDLQAEIKAGDAIVKDLSKIPVKYRRKYYEGRKVQLARLLKMYVRRQAIKKLTPKQEADFAILDKEMKGIESELKRFDMEELEASKKIDEKK